MIITAIGCAAAGAAVGFVAAEMHKGVAQVRDRRERESHQKVLNAYAQACREVLSDGWHTKVYRRIQEILKDNGQGLGFVVAVGDRANDRQRKEA